MTLEKFVAVDTVYTRSINLERDVDSTSIVEGYIPTTRALLTLRRIEETLGDFTTFNNAMKTMPKIIFPQGLVYREEDMSTFNIKLEFDREFHCSINTKLFRIGYINNDINNLIQQGSTSIFNPASFIGCTSINV